MHRAPEGQEVIGVRGARSQVDLTALCFAERSEMSNALGCVHAVCLGNEQHFVIVWSRHVEIAMDVTE
ncbi:MAG: Uncharacterised protein [Cellulomonadaceae bacterium TMED98]|nr:MAG: Uncharacterised protein [Cellulomonadaceae bacterium TMED98]